MERDLDELIEMWQNQNSAYRLEGDRGLENLEKLISVLGYKRHGFRFGELIEVFLSDNPGAAEAIVNWIGEQNNIEWKDSLKSEVTEEDDDEEKDYANPDDE